MLEKRINPNKEKLSGQRRKKIILISIILVIFTLFVIKMHPGYDFSLYFISVASSFTATLIYDLWFVDWFEGVENKHLEWITSENLHENM